MTLEKPLNISVLDLWKELNSIQFRVILWGENETLRRVPDALRSVVDNQSGPSPSDRFCGRRGVEQEGSDFSPPPHLQVSESSGVKAGQTEIPAAESPLQALCKTSASPRSPPKPAEASHAPGQTAMEGPTTVLTPAKQISRADTEIWKQFLSLLDLIPVQGIVLRPGTLPALWRAAFGRLRETPVLPEGVRKSPSAFSCGGGLLPSGSDLANEKAPSDKTKVSKIQSTRLSQYTHLKTNRDGYWLGGGGGRLNLCKILGLIRALSMRGLKVEVLEPEAHGPSSLSLNTAAPVVWCVKGNLEPPLLSWKIKPFHFLQIN